VLDVRREELVRETRREQHDDRLVFAPVETDHLADAPVGHPDAIVGIDRFWKYM